MKKLVFLIFLFPYLLTAQELDATIIVNYEQLETSAKERIVDFENAIGNYLNTTKFSNEVWEGERIKCSFNIFFISASGETRYSAQLVVSSQRPIYNSERNSLMMSVLDAEWDFEYEKNQSFYFDPQLFDPLISMLDFYAYLIIGFDMDSYGPDPMGGSPFFNLAFDIAIRGASSAYSNAWQSKSTSYNKRGIVDDLMNGKFAQFREDIMNYHYNGIDVIANKKYKKAAQESIVSLIDHLADKKDQINPRSVLLKVFFDAKAGEIVNLLNDYSDKSVFTKLKKINPGNTSKYDDALLN